MDYRLHNQDTTQLKSPQVTGLEKKSNFNARRRDRKVAKDKASSELQPPTEAKLESLTHERRGRSESIRIVGASLTTRAAPVDHQEAGNRQCRRSGEARSTAMNHPQLAAATEVDDRKQEDGGVGEIQTAEGEHPKTEQQRDGGGKVGRTAQGSSQTANSASARLPPSLVVVAAHTRHSSTCTVAAARGLGQSASRAWARPLAACQPASQFRIKWILPVISIIRITDFTR